MVGVALPGGAGALVLLRDVLLPGAVVLVPPALFGNFLDRAESLSVLQFWRLAYRGLPDLAVVILGCLVARLGIGVRELVVSWRRR